MRYAKFSKSVTRPISVLGEIWIILRKTRHQQMHQSTRVKRLVFIILKIFHLFFWVEVRLQAYLIFKHINILTRLFIMNLLASKTFCRIFLFSLNSFLKHFPCFWFLRSFSFCSAIFVFFCSPYVCRYMSSTSSNQNSYTVDDYYKCLYEYQINCSNFHLYLTLHCVS